MKKKKWIWTMCAILVLALLFIAGFQWWAPLLSAQTLTEDEAKQAAKEKYHGDILKTRRSENEYQVEMELEAGVYLIWIDAENGDVISIKRVKKAEEAPKDKALKQLTQKEIQVIISSQGDLLSMNLVQEKNSSYYKAVVRKNNEKITLKVDPFTGDIISLTKQKARIITENEAIAIAEKQVKGAVDDVDLYHPENQTPYYLVEVELEDDREAVIQIDAYTREAKTVSWEDHAEDEGDDE